MAQVVAHYDDLQALQTDVVTISFGTPYWSQIWRQETLSPFPFLRDPQRLAYHAYGLESSRWRSWGLANLWYYAQAKGQGRQIFGQRGDPHQLGGDFIIDKAGIIRLAHPSREPTDRPPIIDLLAVIGKTI